MNIPIIEAVPVIQGEGKTAGQPRLLIRVNGCNLRCQYCDTKYSWTLNPELVDDQVVTDLLYKHGEWMITGGEPLLYADQLVTLIGQYRPEWVELETCGALIPQSRLILDSVNLWNISPKRAVDQAVKDTDTTPHLLKYHKDMKDFLIKIVVTPDTTEDELKAQLGDYDATYNISDLNRRVWLMPQTDQGNFVTADKAWELARKFDLNYSDRLHVRVFGAKRGV